METDVKIVTISSTTRLAEENVPVSTFKTPYVILFILIFNLLLFIYPLKSMYRPKALTHGVKVFMVVLHTKMLQKDY